MIDKTPMDKFIKQMTFSFMNEGEQMWFLWGVEKEINPKPRKRTKLRKKNKKNE